jgi:predicted nucleotidyltransferase
MDKVQKIVECLKNYQPERVIIFGSCARGDADEQSDVDVVVIKQTDKRFLDRLLEVARFLDNDLGKVDVFVYTREEFEDMRRQENPFITKVVAEGRVIYSAQ